MKAAGGDGLTVMYALRPLVEHNTADSVACEMNDRVYREPGNRMGKVAAAIWPWKCKDALLRCNEAVDTRLNQDGMAYDADSGDGTVYEHNYSRMNEGGCVMFCLEERPSTTPSAATSATTTSAARSALPEPGRPAGAQHVLSA